MPTNTVPEPIDLSEDTFKTAPSPATEIPNQEIPAADNEVIDTPLAKPLFIVVTMSDPPNITDTPTIVRAQYVDINLDLLDQSKVGESILLNLFVDVAFTTVLDRRDPTNSGSYTWIGHIDGLKYSQIILIVGGGQVAGNITLPGSFYEIRYVGNNVHAIYEIDQSAFPPGDEPISIDE